jgi:hypothetical protein
LLGLALGCEPKSLGLDKNTVPPWALVERVTAGKLEAGPATEEVEAAASSAERQLNDG